MRVSPTLMPRPRPADIVRAFLRARDQGEADVAVTSVHPAAVWESPVHGEVRGRRAIRDALLASTQETDWFRSHVAAIHEHGRLVIAQVRSEGEELDSMQALVFRVHDGLITSVTAVVDDQADDRRARLTH